VSAADRDHFRSDCKTPSCRTDLLVGGQLCFIDRGNRCKYFDSRLCVKWNLSTLLQLVFSVKCKIIVVRSAPLRCRVARSCCALIISLRLMDFLCEQHRSRLVREISRPTDHQWIRLCTLKIILSLTCWHVGYVAQR